MKRYMKRVLLVLCMMTCLFSLSACGQKEAGASNVDPSIEASLQQQTVGLLENIVSIPVEQMGMLIEQNREGGAEAVAAGLENYVGLSEDLGAYVSSGVGSTIQNEDGFSITVEAMFEKRQADFVIGLDADMINITSMTFNPVYTMKENMVKAGLNMLMGMGTVFLVLIFISALIGCFKYINAWENKRMSKDQTAPEVQAPPVTAPVLEETEPDLTDDLELVAVITAAITASIEASQGTPADGLVVRSIRRAPAGKWKNA